MSSSFSTSGYSMKRVSQMTALALALGLACASSGLLKQHRRLPQPVTAKARRGDRYPSERFYNGWPQSLNGPSGHEPSALNLSAARLDKMNNEQLSARVKSHQLNTDAPVALYGNDNDIQAVKARLQKLALTISPPSAMRLRTLPACNVCRTSNSWCTHSGCTTCSRVKRNR